MMLSVVIVEYHCMELVQKCLASVRRHLSEIQTECIVVSNSAYTEKQLKQFRATLVDATLVTSNRNLGYAGGVNVGMREAQGKYAYILNPDCMLADGNIVEIIDLMERHKSWAIAGPKVTDERGAVQPSCRRFPKPWTFLLLRTGLSRLSGAGRERDRYLMNDFDRLGSRNVDWVSGGATIVKSAILGDIGGMDDRYFLYMEDVDFCRMAWQKGYSVVYCPLSNVVHTGRHESIKVKWGMFANRHLYWHIVSLIKYFRKHRWRAELDSGFYRSYNSTALSEEPAHGI